jgi:hypothetical protein
MAIWYILRVIWYSFSVLVCCIKKNLATLIWGNPMITRTISKLRNGSLEKDARAVKKAFTG